MSRSFSIRTHVHRKGQVRLQAWTGRTNARLLETSFEGLGRAAVLGSIAVSPSDDDFRLEGEMRAAQLTAAFELDTRGGPVLSRRHVQMLRDFSRNGRAGDFGQAVGILVCQQRLGLPFVVDYERFCAIVGRPVSSKETRPDYVGFSSPEACFFSVIECKGRYFPDALASKASVWRATLMEANKQGEAGYQNIAQRRYGTPRGVNQVVSILALGHGPGRNGITAQVMTNNKEVDPWELNTAQRRNLRRLCYEMWGTMAGGGSLGQVLRGPVASWNHVWGRHCCVDGQDYWVPDFHGSGVAPFALLRAMHGGNRSWLSQPLHGIGRMPLRALLEEPETHAVENFESEDSSQERDSEVTKYGDGTVLFDEQAARVISRSTLAQFALE